MFRNLWQKKKWIEINDISSVQYSVDENIRFKTSMLISDSPDYTDAYIVLKGGKKLTFKNYGFFRCISKINNTSIDNAEDNGIVMSLYNLLQYSDNYSLTSGSLWNYYRDEINDDENENDNNNRINYNKTTRSKSFENKTKTIGKHQMIIIN